MSGPIDLTITDVSAEVRTELSSRGVTAALEPCVVETLGRLVRGLLRASATVPAPDRGILREHALAHVVDAFQRRPDPRALHAPMMPVLVREALRQHGARVPWEQVVEVLARVAVGFLGEATEWPLAPAKVIAARSVCDLYLLGTPGD